MNLPDTLTKEKRELLEKLVERLVSIPHMRAVVLGGSYAAGTAQAASDLDVGLYYLDAEPFLIKDIRSAAGELARPGSIPTVTGFYEWGAWVNGGAWIQTSVSKLDFLYRSLDQITRTIREAQEGTWRHDYDQQPSHGYYSTGYLAETQICIPLFDPEGRISELKSQVEHYPPALKEKIPADALWSAEFTLMHAREFAKKGDIYNTAGCLVRAAANLTQALFALNERYFLSDKKVMETIEGFKDVPEGYTGKVASILGRLGKNREELTRSVEAMVQAWKSVVELTRGGYRPKFQGPASTHNQ